MHYVVNVKKKKSKYRSYPFRQSAGIKEDRILIKRIKR